jgi:hypothetical protein
MTTCGIGSSIPHIHFEGMYTYPFQANTGPAFLDYRFQGLRVRRGPVYDV